MMDSLFFYLSKIFWFMVEPGNILFLLLLVGVFFLFIKRHKTGTFFCSLALIFFITIGVFPIGKYLVHLLENRFDQVSEKYHEIDGIIVLGGLVDVYITHERQQLSLNSNVERITILNDLTKRHPTVPIIFTGGAGLIGYPELNEAKMLRAFLKELMRGDNPLLIEDRSRNTYENGVFSREIIEKLGGGRWLLVTSASHIPRAVGVFRHQNIDVVPYPVDYSAGPDFKFEISLKARSGFSAFAHGLHEWLGLFVYYLTDRSSAIFPAPQP